MNEHIKKLIELDAIVGGKIKSVEEFTVFERLSNDQLQDVAEEEKIRV